MTRFAEAIYTDLGVWLGSVLRVNAQAYDTLADIEISSGPGGQDLSLWLHWLGNLVGGVRSRLAS